MPGWDGMDGVSGWDGMDGVSGWDGSEGWQDWDGWVGRVQQLQLQRLLGYHQLQRRVPPPLPWAETGITVAVSTARVNRMDAILQCFLFMAYASFCLNVTNCYRRLQAVIFASPIEIPKRPCKLGKNRLS